jgi:hypothetical protein
MPLVQPGDRVRKGDPIALVWEHDFVHFAVKELRPSGEIFFDEAQLATATALLLRRGDSSLRLPRLCSVPHAWSYLRRLA